jgi:TonB family protein
MWSLDSRESPISKGRHVSDIFLSYASADRPRVKPLVDVLRQQGWSVWWDRTILPGKTWDQVIEAALAEARCVIVLWSRDSVQSDWVRTEADEAKRRGILVPALLDDVNIPLAFRRIQAANLADWSGVLPSAGFDQLAQAVSEILSTTARFPFEATTRAATAASEGLSVERGDPFQKADQGHVPAETTGKAKAEQASPQTAEQGRLVREAETKREPPQLAVTEGEDRSPLFDVPGERTLRKRVIIFGLPAFALLGIMIYALTPAKQAELPPISIPRGAAQEDLPPPPPAEPAAKVVNKVIPRVFDTDKQVVPQRIRVGGQVQAANLIKKVSPPYPALAKDARIEGQVRFTAIIGKDGTIQDLQLVSGHPLLAPAATEAVKQWMYKPTLMNGEPVEVITEIDVNFTLSQ